MALRRVLATLLFGANPRESATLGAVAGVLVLIALVSCYPPSRRATWVDPMFAMRCE
jgi:ABC-type lipoprotein release transport system permease subunit